MSTKLAAESRGGYGVQYLAKATSCSSTPNIEIPILLDGHPLMQGRKAANEWRLEGTTAGKDMHLKLMCGMDVRNNDLYGVVEMPMAPAGDYLHPHFRTRRQRHGSRDRSLSRQSAP